MFDPSPQKVSKASSTATGTLVGASREQRASHERDDEADHKKLDFTIVVPANLRFRGSNMTLDLQLGRIDLSKAMEDASVSASSTSRDPATPWKVSAKTGETIAPVSRCDESENLVDSTTNDFFLGDSPSWGASRRGNSPHKVDSRRDGEVKNYDNLSLVEDHEASLEVSSVNSRNLRSCFAVAADDDADDNQVSTSKRTDDAFGETECELLGQASFYPPISDHEISASHIPDEPMEEEGVQKFMALMPYVSSPSDTAEQPASLMAEVRQAISIKKEAVPGHSGDQRAVIDAQALHLPSNEENHTPDCSYVGAGDLALLALPDSKRATACNPTVEVKKRGKSTQQSMACQFDDPQKGQCKQRAILSFKYCIRHILFDPAAPYRQCAYKRRPKGSRSGRCIPCTNAIRKSKQDIYCSTHLMMMSGMREPRRKVTTTTPQAVVEEYAHHEGVGAHSYSHNKANLVQPNCAAATAGPLVYGHPTFYSPQLGYVSSVAPQEKLQQKQEQSQTQHQSQSRLAELRQQHPQLAAKLLQPPQTSIQHSHYSSSHTAASSDPHSFHQNSSPSTKPPAVQALASHSGHYNYITQPGISTPTIHPHMEAFKYTEASQQAMEQRQLSSDSKSSLQCQAGTDGSLQKSQRATKMLTGERSLTLCRREVPHSVFVGSKPEAFPLKYDTALLDGGESGYLDDELRIKRDYLNCQAATHEQKKKPRIIKLRQKHASIRLRGPFRRGISAVEEMCRTFESHDYDSADLFPLGLEPSDSDEDEESLDAASFPRIARETWSGSLSALQLGSAHTLAASSKVELYLTKKQLRLESCRLVQQAKLTVPVMQSAKFYKNLTGQALRVRLANKRREAPELKGVVQPSAQRCFYTATEDIHDVANRKILKRTARCRNTCLPMLNSCAEHIPYNVDQKLFVYCSRRCCGKPVLGIDTPLTGGFCRRHFEESLALDKQLTTLRSIPPLQPASATRMKNDSCDGGSSLINANNHCGQAAIGPSTVVIRQASTNNRASFASHSEQNNAVNGIESSLAELGGFEEDLSLASVAKDLGFDSGELTDMLEQSLEAGIGEAPSFLATVIRPVDEEPRISSADAGGTGHSWADVDEFLLSEGYHGE